MEENKETPVTEAPEQTPREKLRADNDEMEKELTRHRELLAEKQTIEANKALGGSTGGHVEAEVKEETPQDYADKVMSGELNG